MFVKAILVTRLRFSVISGSNPLFLFGRAQNFCNMICLLSLVSQQFLRSNDFFSKL
uniref:Uncharacterized protein n=1 Tax=Rhizophora mucronata TaxID=61149 RepID=A0A2P2P1T5_RHIMU